jgi:hypothetical protein
VSHQGGKKRKRNMKGKVQDVCKRPILEIKYQIEVPGRENRERGKKNYKRKKKIPELKKRFKMLNLFIHLPVEGHPGSFHLLSVVDNSSISIHMQVCI